MNADSSFYIGKSHDICEDYAFHLNAKDRCLAIVADGCSGSPNTDFGSRILTASFVNAQNQFIFKDPSLMINAITRANLAAANLNLHPDALDSTLLCLQSFSERQVSAAIAGDGLLVFKTQDQIRIYKFEYLSGYPYFPNYELYKDRKKTWLDSGVGVLRICKKVDNGNFEEYEYNSLDNSFRMYNIENTIYCEFDHSQLEYALIMSDGVFSFYEEQKTDTSKTKREVLLEEVLDEFLKFKNFNGEFVKRRMKRFRKDCEKKGWFHTDDFSVAGISFES